MNTNTLSDSHSSYRLEANPVDLLMVPVLRRQKRGARGTSKITPHTHEDARHAITSERQGDGRPVVKSRHNTITATNNNTESQNKRSNRL